MLVQADRVRELTATTGTGDITLAGAVAGYQAFGDVCADQDSAGYCIVLGSEWETGEGIYNLAGDTLTRSHVLASSNAGALVDFSAGDKAVFLTPIAAHIRARPRPALPAISNLVWRISAEFSPMTLTQDGRVSQINDISGTGAPNFTATTTARPRLHPRGLFKDRPALLFNGTTSRLTASATKTIAQPLTVITVAEGWDSGTSMDNLFRDSGSGPVAYRNGSSQWAIYAGTELASTALQTQNTEDVADGVNAPAIIVSLFNGASSVLGNNGTEVTGDAGTGGISGTMRVGGDSSTSFAKLRLYEWLVFSKALSSPERAQLVAYYAAMLGLP